MTQSIRAGLPLLVLGALALMPAWGCQTNDRGNATPEVPVTPTQDVLLAEGEFTHLAASQEGKNIVDASRVVPFKSTIATDLAPSVRAQVNWTLADDDFVVAIYPEGCTSQQLGLAGCTALAQGSHPYGTATGSVVTLSTARPGNYVLGIQNLGPHAESGAFQVVVHYNAS